MFAIVKFRGSPFPTIMAVENVGYVYDLSTMARVEWVCAATISSDGKIIARKDMSSDTLLGDISIKPFQPGDPDPLGKYRTNVGGDLVRTIPPDGSSNVGSREC